MMKTLIITICLFCGGISFGQKRHANLILKDGTQLEGLAEVSPSKTIRFRKEQKAKKQWFTFHEVDTLKLYHRQDVAPTIYVNVPVKNRTAPLFLELVQKGKKVICYQEIATGYMEPAAFPNGSFNGGPNTGRFYSISSSYLRRVNEKEAIQLVSNQLFTKNFKKAATDFFADCPGLVDKIRNRELKKKNLNEIIDFYNTKCD